jgi:O-antigen ligase
VINVVCGLVGVEAVLALVRYFGGGDFFHSGSVLRASGTYGAPSALYRVLLAALPMTVSLALVRQKAWSRALWIVAAFVIGLALTLTWYRTAAVAACCAVLWLLYRVKVSRRTLMAALCVFVIIVFATAAIRVHDQRSASSSARSASSHTQLWRAGYREFLKHPLTGSGMFRVRVPSRVCANGGWINAQLLGPHNQLLFVMCESGAVGALLFAAFVYCIYRILNSAGDIVALGLCAGWIALLVAGTTDTMFGIASDEYGPINAMVAMMIGATFMVGGSNASSNHELARSE